MLRYLAQPATLLGLAIAFVVGLLGHNLCQAWAARACGDTTAVRAGYGRIGAQQLDPLGVVAAVLTVAGWGFTAPVPVDTRFRAQRPRATVALLAGPVYLLVLTGAADALTRPSMHGFALHVAAAATVCSAGLFVTSLLPFPPLALGRALWLYLPTSGGWSNARYRLEHDNLGRLIAFAILMLPLVFGAFPDIVGELVTPLVRHVGTLVGGAR